MPAADPASKSAGVTIKLRSVLGVAFGVATVVGTIIGAGILRAPGEHAARLPTPALFFAVWIAGAIYSLGGANALCELASVVPRSGGQYNFSLRALGRYAGFYVGWNDWLSTAGSVTGVAIVWAETVGALFYPLHAYTLPVAAALILGFTLLLWRGVKIGARAQYVTTSLKSFAFLALIGAGFWYAIRHGIARPGPVTAPHGAALLAAFVISMQGVLYAYDGWNGAIYFTEEMTDPGRDVARSTFGGLLSVTAVYLLVLTAFILVVPLPALAGKELAAGEVARTIFGDRGDTVIRLVIVLSLPSYANAVLPMSTRVLFGMSRDRLAPKWATKVNAGGTPTMALLASCVVALLFLFTGTINAVFAVLSFLFVASYTLSFIAVFVLRKREPDSPRAYRAWGHPWTTGIMVLGSVAFLVGSIWSDPRNGLIAAAIVAVSYPIYRVLRF